MDNRLNKCGPMISATYGVELIDGEQCIDMEFLLPIDGELKGILEYDFKPEFYIKSSLYTRFSGNQLYIGKAYEKLMDYIAKHNLEKIRVGYHVNVNEEEMRFGKEPVIDIYTL